MDKNRRKTPHSPFSNSSLKSKSHHSHFPFHSSDKQNEAKLALLDLGNDDTMIHIDSILGDQHPSRNSLIQQMKAHETQILNRKTHNKIFSAHQIHALLPIDNNCNFQVDNFVENKPMNSGKKQKFSLRNTLYFSSKENMLPFAKEIEGKKQEQTILKLKKILKKLQSPQKKRHHQQENHQKHEQKIKKKKSSNKIAEFCAQFIHLNMPASKQKPVHEFESHQKLIQSFKEYPKETVKLYEFRTGSKTSHEKNRSTLSRVPGTSTPTAFAYKPTKLTNKDMLFKRNSVATAELGSQKRNNTGIKKTSARMVHQASRSHFDQFYADEMFLQNQKRREDRKSRNLKNILFD